MNLAIGVAGAVLALIGRFASGAGSRSLLIRRNGQSIAQEVHRLSRSCAATARGLAEPVRSGCATCVIWLSSIIPLFGVCRLLDALFIFGESRQCLHDKIADTIVDQGLRASDPPRSRYGRHRRDARRHPARASSGRPDRPLLRVRDRLGHSSRDSLRRRDRDGMLAGDLGVAFWLILLFVFEWLYPVGVRADAVGRLARQARVRPQGRDGLRPAGHRRRRRSPATCSAPPTSCRSATAWRL